MSKSTIGWAMEQEEIALKRRLRDQAALAALPAVIRVCAGDRPRDALDTFEEMFAQKAWAVADAFVAAREDENDV